MQPRADPGAQRNEVLVPQQFQQSAVSREDHGQQRGGVEVGTGEDPQLAEHLGSSSPGLRRSSSTGLMRDGGHMGLPALAEGFESHPNDWTG